MKKLSIKIVTIIFFQGLLMFFFSNTYKVGATTLFSDNFDRPDANTLGPNWVSFYGSLPAGITNNQAYITTQAGGNYSFYKVNGLDTQDQDITATFVHQNGDSAVFARVINVSNRIIVNYYQSEALQVYEAYQGNYRVIANTAPNAIVGNTYTVRVSAIGSILQVWVNGIQYVNTTLDHITVGSAGIGASDGYTNVLFDNFTITDGNGETPTQSPTPSPTPTIAPTATPTATPTPTPSPTLTPTPTPTSTSSPISSPIGNFELPFSYTGRLTNNALLFKDAFWQRITAGFDHAFAIGLFRPFTGNIYFPSDCPGGVFGIKCYDSHNGTDFSRFPNNGVLSVANGQIVFTSDHTNSSCTPNSGGFGCVVIAKYSGNNYTLFAHLSQISVNDNQSVSNSTQIGVMGETGCPGCGVHLHFGVLKPNSPVSAVNHMSRSDWKTLLYKIQPSNAPSYPPFCNYIAPNGANFTFVDPSGWMGGDKDPWSLPKNKGGCGVNSQYLWKFPVGTSP